MPGNNPVNTTRDTELTIEIYTLTSAIAMIMSSATLVVLTSLYNLVDLTNMFDLFTRAAAD